MKASHHLKGIMIYGVVSVPDSAFSWARLRSLTTDRRHCRRGAETLKAHSGNKQDMAMLPSRHASRAHARFWHSRFMHAKSYAPCSTPPHRHHVHTRALVERARNLASTRMMLASMHHRGARHASAVYRTWKVACTPSTARGSSDLPQQSTPMRDAVHHSTSVLRALLAGTLQRT